MTELKRQYELTFIIPPTLAEEDIKAIQATVQGWITDQEGEILKENHWGRRKLAYPIQNYKEGYYILLEFESQPSIIKELERRMRLSQEVIRYLVVRAEE